MQKPTLTIIGGGNMGTSLIGGLLADHYPANKIWITDVSEEKLEQLQNQFGVNTTTDNNEAANEADIIILAVKPQILADVAIALKPIVQKNKPLILSIAAGIRETSIQQWLGDSVAVVRAMPNTPALIGCGATGLYANQYVNDAQRNSAESILRSVGIVVWLDNEKLLDVVTALSGSGPAYFFLFMEAMQDIAEKLGLDKATARLLTLETGFGASRMALESDASIAELRQRVTSKGGTTEAALSVLEKENVSRIIADAVKAAAHRSEELANLFDEEHK